MRRWKGRERKGGKERREEVVRTGREKGYLNRGRENMGGEKKKR